MSDVELFGYYENIFTSALDYGDYTTADKYLQLLINKFPQSSRVKRLLGMGLESQGEYENALKLYDEILAETPTNLLVLKRKVAIFRAQGNMKLAVEALHDIVKLYQSDSSSWLELADIHLTLCDYNSAAFCLEEVILLNPTTAAYHTKLAEVLYTIGDVQNLIKARKHYSISLNLASFKCNTRALYGLAMTCKVLLAQKRLPPNEDMISKEFLAWVQDKLNERNHQDRELVGQVMSGIISKQENISDLD